MEILVMIFGIILGIIFILTFIAALIIIWLFIIDEIKEHINKNKEDK